MRLRECGCGRRFHPTAGALVSTSTIPSTWMRGSMSSITARSFASRTIRLRTAIRYGVLTARTSPSGRARAAARTISTCAPRTCPDATTEGGASPTWSKDDRELFYRRGNAMMHVPIDAVGRGFRFGTANVLFEGPYVAEEDSLQSARNYAVAPDGRRFVMIKDDDRRDRE